MSAGTVLQYVGAIVSIAGYPYIGVPISAAGTALNYYSQPDTYGPTLDDLKVQTSSYGVSIPDNYASVRQAGNVIWQTDLQQHAHSHSSKGGPKNTTYSYTQDVAIGICRGPILGIARIWNNKQIWYDARMTNTGLTADPRLGTLRIYIGDETQQPDPLIVATQGSSPAYRGLAYVVIEGWEATETRGRAQWEFEVVVQGASGVSKQIYAEDLNIDGYPANTVGGWVSPDACYLSRMSAFNSGPVTVHRLYPDGSSTLYRTFGVAAGLGSPVETVVPVLSNSTPMFAQMQIVRPPDEGGLVYQEIRLTDLQNPESDSEDSRGGSLLHLFYDETDATLLRGLLLVSFDDDSKIAAFALGNQPIGYYGQQIRLTGQRIPASTAIGEIAAYKHPHYETAGGVTVQSGRTLISFQLYQGMVWVLNRDNGVGGTHALYLTRFDQTTFAQIDEWAGPSYSFASSGYTDTMLRVNEHGAFAWVSHDTGSGRAIIKFTSSGYSTLCSDVDGPYPSVLNAPHIVNTFWTDGSSAIIGPTVAGGISAGVPPTGFYRINFNALTQTGVSLASIVSDRCVQSGLQTSDINVSALTDTVFGYSVPRQMSGRAGIQPLQQAYFFDAVESDDVLKFVKRGGSIAATIPMDDRAAHQDGQALPDHLKIARMDDPSLPQIVDVEYVDASADYLVGNQYERRLTRDAKSIVDLKLAIAMTGDKAKQVAQTSLYSAWLTNSYSWSTTLKWSHLEPTDVVLLPTTVATYAARITKKTEHPTGIIEWQGVEEDSAVYSQNGVGMALGYLPQTIQQQVRTDLTLLDIPIGRDADNDPGFYAKVSPTGSNWPGASVYQDDGSLTLEGSASTPSIVGTTLTALPDYSGPNVFDEVNTVDIAAFAGTATSVTRDQALSGMSAWLIGNGIAGEEEILIARDVTLIGTLRYRLGGLLRYRLGTEGVTHAVSDRVVQLGMAGMVRINHGAGDIGVPRKFVPITFGGSFLASDEKTFRNTARGLKPFSPVNLRADYGTTPITLSWHRRSRLVTRFLSAGVDAPLGEASERYEIDIRDVSGALTASLSSTSPRVAIPTWSAGYTATVFPLSETVGRGNGAGVTL